ncbi:MAG: WYL domain-containing protein [Candidatus Sumerlaeia bacterium]|nr:WYL domain-containing protein [Candidatus Sumerlaeia bacterium]
MRDSFRGVPTLARQPGQRATKYGAKGFRLLRAWTTLLLLAEPGEPPTATEIVERLRARYPFLGLELSVQTTRSDLRLLGECGFPVVPLDGSGNEIDLSEFDSLTGKLKGTRWSLRSPSRLGELHCEGLPRPSVADVLALNLLRAALGQCAPAGFWLAPSVRRLLDEVSRLQAAPAAASGSVRVQLRFRALDAALVGSVLPRHRQVQGSAGDGWTHVEFDASAKEAQRLVLSLADLVVVEAPASVRQAVAQRHRKAWQQYLDTDSCPDNPNRSKTA